MEAISVKPESFNCFLYYFLVLIQIFWIFIFLIMYIKPERSRESGGKDYGKTLKIPLESCKENDSDK